MNQLIGILGNENVAFIRNKLEELYEERGAEWEGDFMMIPTGKLEIEDKLPNPILGWFDTVVLERTTISVSALSKHQANSEGYPSEEEINNAFSVGNEDNLVIQSNGTETLSVGIHFGDRTIMEVFGIGE